MHDAHRVMHMPRKWPVHGWTKLFFKYHLLEFTQGREKEWAQAFIEADGRHDAGLVALFPDCPNHPRIRGPVACRALYAASKIADFPSVDRIFKVLSSAREIAFEPWCYITKSVTWKMMSSITRSRAETFRRLSVISHSLTKKKKRRIAYLSKDFKSHSAGVPLAPLINAHDSDLFDVVVFDLSKGGEFRNSLGAIPLGHLNIGSAQELIVKAKADVLVDTTVNLRDGCEWLRQGFGGRLIHGWGYDGANIGTEPHLAFGDSVLKPYGTSSVNLCRYLPFNFKPTQKIKLKGTKLKFAAFGPTYKISRRLFRAWMQILIAVPSSELHLMAGGQKNMCREAERCGVSPDRLLFQPFSSPVTHQRRLGEIDIALDNSRLGGSHFMLDALSVGLPTVCYPGRRFVDSSGRSIAHALGLPTELIPSTLKDYVETAILLAKSSKLYEKMCRAIAELPSMDSADVARDVEKLVELNLGQQNTKP